MRWSGNIHDSGRGRRSEGAEGQNFNKSWDQLYCGLTRHNADRKKEKLTADDTDRKEQKLTTDNTDWLSKEIG